VSSLIRRFIFSLLVILCAGPDGWAQTEYPSHSNSLSVNPEAIVMSVINEAYNCEFDNALEGTNQLIEILPEDPEGYFYRAGTFKRMLEEGCLASDDSTKREIRLLIDKACRLSEQKLDEYPNSAEAHFYYAASLVYRAWYEAADRNWIAVMSDGIKVRKTLEKAIEIDPNFFDAYTGIGAFNCYAARIPWFLKPLALVLGVSGDEEKGIAQLKKAAELGKYAKTEATLFLGSVVYVDKEEYSSAATLMLKLHENFPKNLYFVQYLCRDYYELHDYNQAINVADDALEVGDPTGSCQRERLSFIQFYRGKSYERIGERDKAIADYRVIVRLDGNRYAGKDAEAALEKWGVE